jgi:hypothetical protein
MVTFFFVQKTNGYVIIIKKMVIYVYYDTFMVFFFVHNFYGLSIWEFKKEDGSLKRRKFIK